MKRIVLAAIAVAASATLASPLAAQSSMHKKNTGRQTTITGCLEKSPAGGFRLTSVENRSVTSPKGTSGNYQANMPQAWDLKGGTNLDQNVGHKIQVTGYAETGTKSQMKGTSGTTGEQTQSFDVRSFRSISSTCP